MCLFSNDLDGLVGSLVSRSSSLLTLWARSRCGGYMLVAGIVSRLWSVLCVVDDRVWCGGFG
jgi:hypothetical protein